jgi:uncharacterized membrane protein
MNQTAINEAEWRNPGNWTRWGMARVYSSKRDTRVVIPKANPTMGWTLNFAHPVSKYILVGTLLLPIILAVSQLPLFDILTVLKRQ